MPASSAYSPAHVTGLFVIYEDHDPMITGSKGAGVSLVRGVHTHVKASRAHQWELSFSMNGSPCEAPVSKAVVSRFIPLADSPFNITVEHEVEVPVGSGYGASAAGALSLALALNEAFGVGLTYTEAAQIAHLAELDCRTGLGGVLAETVGGLEMRVGAGAPGVGVVERIPIEGWGKVLSLYLGPLSTPLYLRSHEVAEKVNRFGRTLLRRLIEQPTPLRFLHCSRRFADLMDLYSPPLRKVLQALDAAVGGRFVMNMFGEALFTLCREEELAQLLHLVERHRPEGARVIVSDVAVEGARLLG